MTVLGACLLDPFHVTCIWPRASGPWAIFLVAPSSVGTGWRNSIQTIHENFPSSRFLQFLTPIERAPSHIARKRRSRIRGGGDTRAKIWRAPPPRNFPYAVPCALRKVKRPTTTGCW